jgi:CDP-glycerol glycerophosphotransferase
MSDNIKVSVIVPIYNVEEYLNECLDSLANQTLKEIEVLIVNDASTDSSGEIALEYVDKYNNFRLFNKSLNAGQSRARNYAITFAKGEYIAFLDGDDFVSLDAYKKLYDMSANGERDIVVGNVKRFDSKGIYDSGLHIKIFKENIKNTTIINYPELIYDTTSTNKLFRKKFWKENELKFPEDVIYEDIPLTFFAHYKSKSTAILSDDIYYWRRREGINKSATQQRTDINNFYDRLNALKIVNNFFKENVDDETLIYYKYYKWLDLDLKLYINILDQTDNAYKKIFIPTVQEYIKNIPEYIFKDLTALDRIKYYFIENGDLKSLFQTLNFEKKGMANLKVVLIGDKYYGKFPFKVPVEYTEMTKELNTSSEVRKIKRITVSNGILNINGYLYINRINFDRKNKVNFKAKLVNTLNRKEFELDIENIKISELKPKLWIKAVYFITRNPCYTYNWSGYNINIDLNDPKFLELGSGTYKIIITLQTSGIDRNINLGSSNNKPRPKPCLVSYNNILFKYNAIGDLSLNIEKQHSGVINTHIKNGTLYLEGWFDDKTLNNILIMEKNGKEIPIQTEYNNNLKINSNITDKFPNSEGFTAIIPYDIIKKLEYGNWNIKHRRNDRIHDINGSDISLSKILDNNLIKLFNTFKMGIILSNKSLKTYLSAINWEKSSLKISICLNKNNFETTQKITGSRLRFVLKKFDETICVERENYEENANLLINRFIVDTEDEKGINLFTQGNWEIYTDYTVDSSVISHKISIIDDNTLETKIFSSHKYKPAVDGDIYSLKVSQVWPWIAKTRKRRKVLELYIYPLLRYLPLNKKRIIFESFEMEKSEGYICYIYKVIDKNYPKYQSIWIVNDESMKLNGNGEKVRFKTLKYFYYIATAKYFINNTNFPNFYKKRKNIVEVQITNHLKETGLNGDDEPKTKESFDNFIRRIKKII